MSNKRKKHDFLMQSITYIATFLSILTLMAIVAFVITKGAPLLNWNLIRNNYQSYNYIASLPEDVKLEDFLTSIEFPENVIYSEKWGLALKDDIDLMGKNIVEVYYVHPNSPLTQLINRGQGNDILTLNLESSVIRIAYVDAPSSLSRYGAAQMIEELNQADSFRELEFTTAGGGIRGSLITTLYLIGLTLAFALPIGIGAALYLNEYAQDNKINRLIRSLIETLTGVPSIIYGLMGLAVFVPITVRLTQASGGNILSGAMTLSVILLPVIIRTTEESLKMVPDDYRFASLALGANHTQTTFKVVLPNAFPGIMTATLLAMGRIIGESAALVFAVGTVIKDEVSIYEQSTSLAVHIWAMMSDEPANIELSSTIALIILMIVLVLNLSIKLISKYFIKKNGVFS